ncbi:peptidoglycan/LPS O-acetylase OafA/YrhL [Krasilnikovia cinnamomea]|uniref:Peptidoglycan/LPS O-acetylase OafA/YrhL n=1 Tax=Krasilnikovia cinnamomea TaxID=349313 RepID=A0A4Q7ZEI9_9ACTN|nr:acyltransferase [Krasilnikovia cinnamomea]RZU48533.1 peptidoglycan/LPS O-acetylase OafA/YrhL [Krasilnikovia cinnamomea]
MTVETAASGRSPGSTTGPAPGTHPGSSGPGSSGPGSPGPDSPGSAGARLGWLDALRGFAALTVVWFHLSPVVLGPERHLRIHHHIDLGKYGVLLFFLVSGYVIPMSLERHGSLRRFWVGRLFRVYPAYLATIAVTGVLVVAGLGGLRASLRADPVTAVLAHATMLMDPLGLRGTVRVFWTLSYEMIFYLVVAGLFAWRLHRHSGWWAAGLAAVALMAGPRLPDGLFAADPGGRRITAAVLLVLVAGVVAACLSGRRRLTLAAGTAGICFLALPALDGHPSADSTVAASWQGLLLLAVMFAGTVVFRAQHGQLGRWPAASALAAVGGGTVAAHAVYLPGRSTEVWLTTVAAVAATFAVAYALRRRAVPRIFAWLGTISYSLYLLHVVVLGQVVRFVPDLAHRPAPQRCLVGAVFLLLALGVAAVSQRVVERPGQALGRRLLRALEGAPGPPRSVPFTTERAAPRTRRRQDTRRSV